MNIRSLSDDLKSIVNTVYSRMRTRFTDHELKRTTPFVLNVKEYLFHIGFYYFYVTNSVRQDIFIHWGGHSIKSTQTSCGTSQDISRSAADAAWHFFRRWHPIQLPT